MEKIDIRKELLSLEEYWSQKIIDEETWIEKSSLRRLFSQFNRYTYKDEIHV